MSDVKDILGLPRQGSEGRQEKRTHATKSAAPKVPKGMSREAFALLDQSHPIMPSVLGQHERSPIRSTPPPDVSARQWLCRWRCPRRV